MDNVEQYREIIQSILQQYADIPCSYGQITTELIVSQDFNHFLLIDEGWRDGLRVHGCLVHIQIRDGKIWIQRDGIEEGVTDELVASGIPKDKIVLAFHPPEVRQYTGYAIT